MPRYMDKIAIGDLSIAAERLTGSRWKFVVGWAGLDTDTVHRLVTHYEEGSGPVKFSQHNKATTCRVKPDRGLQILGKFALRGKKYNNLLETLNNLPHHMFDDACHKVILRETLRKKPRHRGLHSIFESDINLTLSDGEYEIEYLGRKVREALHQISNIR